MAFNHRAAPVVEVLGEATWLPRAGTADDLAEGGTGIIIEDPRGGVVEGCRLFRAKRVLRERHLEGLVMLGEGPFGEISPAEESRHPFRVHDEGSVPPAGSSSALKSGMSVPLRRCRSGDELARDKGLAARIARGAVIKHAAIGGPRPRPVDRLTDAGRIRVIPSRHEVAGGPQAPQKIQQPEAVLPSLRSSADPASCSPALRTTWVGFFGSGRSLSALPENSLAASSGVGLLGFA